MFKSESDHFETGNITFAVDFVVLTDDRVKLKETEYLVCIHIYIIKILVYIHSHPHPFFCNYVLILGYWVLFLLKL